MTSKELVQYYAANPWELIALAVGNAYSQILSNAMDYFPQELTNATTPEELMNKLYFLADNDRFQELSNILNAEIDYSQGRLTKAQREAVLVFGAKARNSNKNAGEENGWSSDNWSEVINGLLQFGSELADTLTNSNTPPPPAQSQDNGQSQELTRQLIQLGKYAIYGLLGLGAAYLLVSTVKAFIPNRN